jgi:type VI secretion system protein VasD
MIAIWALVPLLGCGSTPKPNADDLLEQLQKSKGGKDCARVPIEVFLQASPYLNQNEKGQPMPVEVKVLLLKDREIFDRLDFETVWQSGEEELSDDLVKAATLTVYPGKLKIYPMKPDQQVAYVALVAIFRKPEGRDWQYLFDVRDQTKKCAGKEDLHTIVHAVLKDYRISEPTTETEDSQ